MKNTILFILFIFSCYTLRADSPITSTDLTGGYTKSKNVQAAKSANGSITPGLLKFLTGKGSIGEKAAVINALGWNGDASLNYSQYMQAIYDSGKGESKYTADDYCCMAYLAAMANYFEVTDAKVYAQKAVDLNPKSFTCNMILALITAQEYMHAGTWCDVYKVCDAVRNNGDLKKDLEQKSVDGIFEYIILYKDECK